MKARDHARNTREALMAVELSATAECAWQQCAAAAQVFLTLREDPTFRSLMGAHRGLLDELPALLAPAKSEGGVRSVLHLLVCRAALAPILTHVEMLGWLAHAHPEALVILLGVAVADGGTLASDGVGRFNAAENLLSKKSGAA